VALFSGFLRPRVRSVSMNNCIGQGGRLWTTSSAYTLYTNANQFGSPAQLFVFLDEREDSINDAVFFSDPDTRFQIIDLPASYHDGAGAFGFADGHGEVHLWRDSRTSPVLQPGLPLILYVNMPGNVDIDWLQQHASERR
jgi:hypothetical protein